MDTIVCAVDTPPEGVTRHPEKIHTGQNARRRSGGTRCIRCKRFARLWPGEGQCAGCAGVLALEYVPRQSARGGRGEQR
jgi:hypothetical protein